MKKLFTALLAVTAASLTHAATVTWTSGNLADRISSDVTSITGYYYVLSEAPSSALALADYVDTKTGEVTTGTKYGNAIDATTDIVNVNMDMDIDVGSKNPAYVALIYVAQSSYGGKYAIVTTGVYETDSETGYETANDNTSGALSAYIDDKGGYASAWTAVPEPTSVALLALGLVAVGLKRRVA